MKIPGPQIGKWYKDLQSNALFEVVAWDEAQQCVDIQYLDGEVSEYDLEGWEQLALERAEPPEDWRTPFELDGADNQDPDEPFHPEDWDGPLNHIEPQYTSGVEEI